MEKFEIYLQHLHAIFEIGKKFIFFLYQIKDEAGTKSVF